MGPMPECVVVLRVIPDPDNRDNDGFLWRGG